MRTFGQLAVLTLLAGCAASAQSGNSAGGPAGVGGAKLYSVNQAGASITVIDQQRQEIDTVIDLTKLGFSPTAKPHHIAVEPDGSAWYATLIADGRVLKFDRSNRLVGQVAMETPGLITLDPRHDSLYVGRSMTAVNPPRALGVIRRSTFELVDEQEIVVPRPHALVTTRDGRWIHTASLVENRIASVDVSTGRVSLSEIPGTSRSLVQFTVSPDGRTMVVGGEMSGTLFVYDLNGSMPLVPAAEVAVGSKPWDPVFSPDGRYVFVTLLGDNAVAQVDLQSRSVTRRFTERLAQPDGLIISADGRFLFVNNRNTGAGAEGMSGHDMHDMAGHSATDGWLAVIDIASGKTVKTLMLGKEPTGIGAAGAR